MWKCHSHLFIVFPSCAVNIIMLILVPSRLVDTQRKTSKSKTQKLRPQFLWGRNSTNSIYSRILEFETQVDDHVPRDKEKSSM